MTDDPCLTCPLPDCDEKSPRCPLRATVTIVQRLRSKGWAKEVTAAEKRAYNDWFSMWEIEHAAQRSEGVV